MEARGGEEKEGKGEWKERKGKEKGGRRAKMERKK